MENDLKHKISQMTDDKLSAQEIDKVIDFLKKSSGQDDNGFFKEISYEMTGQVKGLASLILDFKKDLKSKIDPDLTDLTTKYIPQAANQLEGIIETTETAANRIMDNLENIEGNISEVKKIVSSFKNGSITILGKRKKVGANSMQILLPVIEDIESRLENNMSMISDSFTQMSFQDLTGQRIKRIITLVSQMEGRLKNMLIYFGIRLKEKEKNPDISMEELNRVAEEKESEVRGPQRSGQGLDQSDIDDILANL